eukprot:Cvel_9007.t1-p1 / transcript=Cvel_9007.t1 / gene=Cvel_9007 / organism=Chromera_velia_CCMP2878 / gene_product=hypothetical protein / transcript_product=hypothetical protein / location=Cvel_scaffold510:425-2937(-) / protein_length=128 / sequence_SO=supercontig / SO=protein_coding / is_pseudo=false
MERAGEVAFVQVIGEGGADAVNAPMQAGLIPLDGNGTRGPPHLILAPDSTPHSPRSAKRPSARRGGTSADAWRETGANLREVPRSGDGRAERGMNPTEALNCLKRVSSHRTQLPSLFLVFLLPLMSIR